MRYLTHLVVASALMACGCGADDEGGSDTGRNAYSTGYCYCYDYGYECKAEFDYSRRQYTTKCGYSYGYRWQHSDKCAEQEEQESTPPPEPEPSAAPASQPPLDPCAAAGGTCLLTSGCTSLGRAYVPTLCGNNEDIQCCLAGS